jgi:hypothetical protein
VLDELVAAKQIDIAALARANIRAQRARLNLTQASVAKRMRQLGYGWYPQTCGLVERNQRPLLFDELTALALCLETTPDVLALPPPEVQQVTFGEHHVPAQRLSIVDDSVSWDGDDLTVRAPTVQFRPLDLRMAREPDPRVRAGVYAVAEELRRASSGEDVPLPAAQPGDLDAEDLPPGLRPPEPPDK